MPRDRPSAGGQDSTVEGEFPSELVANTAKKEPAELDEPKVIDSQILSGKGIMYVAGEKLGIPSYSGTYTFQNRFASRPVYDSYSLAASTVTNANPTIFTTLNVTKSAANTGEARLHPFVKVFLSAGTTTAADSVGIYANLYNLSPTYFSSYIGNGEGAYTQNVGTPYSSVLPIVPTDGKMFTTNESVSGLEYHLPVGLVPRRKAVVNEYYLYKKYSNTIDRTKENLGFTDNKKQFTRSFRSTEVSVFPRGTLDFTVDIGAEVYGTTSIDKMQVGLFYRKFRGSKLNTT